MRGSPFKYKISEVYLSLVLIYDMYVSINTKKRRKIDVNNNLEFILELSIGRDNKVQLTCYNF